MMCAAAEMSVGNWKSGGLDDVRGHAEAGAKPQNRSRVLGNVRLVKRNLHRVVSPLGDDALSP